MSTLRERVIKKLSDRRENLLSGNINCIPLPFKNFREDFPGIEQGRYICVTGATKSAKSQLSSFLLFEALLYSYEHPDQLSLNIHYYPLEETPEGIMERFMSYLLFTLSDKKVRVSPSDLRSTNNDKPLSKDVLELLESDEYKELLDYFEKCIIFSDKTNPTGVYLECKKYAEENGIVHRKKVKYKDEFGEIVESDRGFDYYEQNNPKEYRLIVYDHVGLCPTEQGKDLRGSMQLLSEHFVELRNRYNYTILNIHQQAMFENFDAFKMDKLEPQISQLADNKALARDYDMCIGIFSPYKYDLHDYKGYNIDIWKDNIRFMNVMVNRNGICNGTLPLYFDGAVSYFNPICGPKDEASLKKWYYYLNKQRSNQ